MITGFFLNLLFLFIGFMIGLLPLGGTFPDAWIQAVNTFWYGINQFSFFLPVSTLVTCIGLMVTFHIFEFAWKGMHWILGLLRGYKH